MTHNQEFLASLTQYYNELLTTALSEEQERILYDYLSEGKTTEIDALPTIDPTSQSYYHDIARGLSKSKMDNMEPTLRFLALIYSKGGTEASNQLLDEATTWSFRGITYDDFFFNGSPLSLAQQVDFYLHALNDQIHRDEIDEKRFVCRQLFTEHPQEFTSLLEKGAPLTKLRCASFLYLENPQRCGTVFNEVLPCFTSEGDAEAIFNACAFTAFQHQELNQVLADIWHAFPAHTADRIAWNKFYYADFIDGSLYSKEYPYDGHPPCEIDYLSKVAAAIGLKDLDLLRGVYHNYDESSQIRYLADFLQKYPQDMILQLFHSTVKTGQNITSVLLHFRQLLPLLQIEIESVRLTFIERYDNMLGSLLANQLLDDEETEDDEKESSASAVARTESSSKREACRLMTAFLIDGEVNIFGELLSDEINTLCIDHLNGSLYDFSTLCGFYAEDPSLAERIKRYAAFIAYTRMLYDSARFIQSVIDQYHWDGQHTLDYFFEREVSTERRLTFLDDHLLSDKEKDPKGKQVLTEKISAMLLAPARNFIAQHEAETIAYCAAQSEDFGLLIAYYQDNSDADPSPLVELLKVKDRKIRNRVLKYIPQYPQLRPQLEELHGAKRKDIRDYADKALAVLQQVNAIVLPGQSVTSAAIDPDLDLPSYTKENLPNAKTIAKLFSFTDDSAWPLVRYSLNEETVERDILRCYVGFYLQSKDIERSFSAERMRPFFHAEDMKMLVIKLYQDWLASGADAKQKGALTLLGIHGGDETIKLLNEAIPHFINHSRSAMAGEAVKAMALSPSTMALVAVDNMARVHRNKLVRRIANETLLKAAEGMGLTLEQLSDKIVPSLGLNERGELRLHTGASEGEGRSFTAILQDDLKIKLINDATGKEIKSFPGFSRNQDDEEAYTVAKTDLSTLRKELRNIIRIQTNRLEFSLASRRSWTTAEYYELFISNPIMQRFATSLIFGVFEDSALIASFRYAGDGSFSNADDEPFDLPSDAQLCIVHPCQLSPEEIASWQEQFSDYGINQPFPQLHRPVFDPTEVHTPTYLGFQHTTLSAYFINKMLGYHWYRGGAGDGGGYYCIFYDDESSGLSACLTFSEGTSIGLEGEDSITLDELVFFKTGSVTPSYSLFIQDHDVLPVAQVPQLFYSELLYRLRQAI